MTFDLTSQDQSLKIIYTGTVQLYRLFANINCAQHFFTRITYYKGVVAVVAGSNGARSRINSPRQDLAAVHGPFFLVSSLL